MGNLGHPQQHREPLLLRQRVVTEVRTLSQSGVKIRKGGMRVADSTPELGEVSQAVDSYLETELGSIVCAGTLKLRDFPSCLHPHTHAHSHPLSPPKLLANCKRAPRSTLKVLQIVSGFIITISFQLPTAPELRSWEGGTYSEEGRGSAGTREEWAGPAKLSLGGWTARGSWTPNNPRRTPAREKWSLRPGQDQEEAEAEPVLQGGAGRWTGGRGQAARAKQEGGRGRGVVGRKRSRDSAQGAVGWG